VGIQTISGRIHTASAVYRGEGTAELLLPGSRKSLHFWLSVLDFVSSLGLT